MSLRPDLAKLDAAVADDKEPNVELVVSLKADPDAMRALKAYAPEPIQLAFNRVETAKVTHAAMRVVMAQLQYRTEWANKTLTYEVVRMPVAASIVNTDNDLRVLYYDMQSKAWRELARQEWAPLYWRAYAEVTGYSPEALEKQVLGGVTPENRTVLEAWLRTGRNQLGGQLDDELLGMKKWAEWHGQLETDISHPEAAADFLTRWGEEPLIPKDARSLGEAFLAKIEEAERSGRRLQALAQADKGWKFLLLVRQSMEMARVQLRDIPKDVQDLFEQIKALDPFDVTVTATPQQHAVFEEMTPRIQAIKDRLYTQFMSLHWDRFGRMVQAP